MHEKNYGNDNGEGRRLVFTGAAVLVIFIAIFIFGSFGLSGSNIILPENKLYAVVLGRYKTESAAQRQAAGLQQRGAAGYVYADGKEYAVLAVCFLSDADAQSVVTKLTQNGEDAQVIILTAPKAVIETDIGKKDAAALRECMSLSVDIMTDLCRLSVEYDNGKLTLNDMISAVAGFVNQAEDAIAKLEAMKKGGIAQAAVTTTPAENLYGILVDLKTSAIDSAAVKKSVCKIFFMWKAFKASVSS